MKEDMDLLTPEFVHVCEVLVHTFAKALNILNDY